MLPDGVARRLREIHVGGVHVRGGRVGRHQPEHRVGARERAVHHGGVAVRALHDLDAPARCRRQARARGDDPDGFLAVEEPFEHLTADAAGRGGDDDHGANSVRGHK